MPEVYDSHLYIARQDQAAAGTTGDKTQTQSASTPWTANLVALKPKHGPKVRVSVVGVAAAVSVGSVSVSTVINALAAVTGQSVNVSCGIVTVETEEAAEGLVGVWNGSAWVDKPAKVWTGTSWAQKPVRHWDGSAWI